MSTEQIQDKSTKGNFFTTGDTITGNTAGHPFMITAQHVAYASDHYSGMLGEEAILACEKRGNGCGYKCGKSITEHKEETALKVYCKLSMFGKKDKARPELHKFLLSLKKKFGTKYSGFAFVQEDGKTAARDKE